MRDCCDLITSPLRLGIANIQTFVIGLHNSFHEMYAFMDQVNHHQARVKKASDSSRSKAERDLQSSMSELKDRLDRIESSFQSPYMEKTKVHYPEMFDLLQQLRVRVQNDKRIKALVPKEP